jgi:hypothetical protein
MNNPTLLEELTKDFPVEEKLRIREQIDRMNIRNPDDDIYRLMFVLGIWGKYYERIPQKLLDIRQQIDDQNQQMLESLDLRLQLLQISSQEVQEAIDRLDGAPQAIVDKFPTEELAKNIAGTIDKDFIELPLTKVQQEVESLNKTLKVFIGSQTNPNEKKDEDKGLVQKIQEDLSKLEQSANKLSGIKFPKAPSLWRDFQVGLITFGLTLFFCWYSWNRPSMQDMKELLQRESFISQRVTIGSIDGNPYISVPSTNLICKEEKSNGDLFIYLKAKEEPSVTTEFRTDKSNPRN